MLLSFEEGDPDKKPEKDKSFEGYSPLGRIPGRSRSEPEEDEAEAWRSVEVDPAIVAEFRAELNLDKQPAYIRAYNRRRRLLLGDDWSPEDAAEDLRHSTTFGVLPEVVASDRDHFRRLSKYEQLEKFLEENPPLEEWFDDPDNLEIGYDDYQPIGRLYDAIMAVPQFFEAQIPQFEATIKGGASSLYADPATAPFMPVFPYQAEVKRLIDAGSYDEAEAYLEQLKPLVAKGNWRDRGRALQEQYLRANDEVQDYYYSTPPALSSNPFLGAVYQGIRSGANAAVGLVLGQKRVKVPEEHTPLSFMGFEPAPRKSIRKPLELTDLDYGFLYEKIAKSQDDAAKAAKKRGEEMLPKTGNVTGDAVIGGLNSTVQSLPSLIAAIITRKPSIALGVTGLQTYGTGYTEAGLEGITDPAKRREYARVMAGIETGTEAIPTIGLIDDLIKGTGFFKMWFRNFVREAPGEQVATFAEDFYKWQTLNPEKSVNDFMAERPMAAYQTMVAVSSQSAANTSFVYAADRLTRNAALKARRAMMTEGEQALDAMLDAAEESKVKTRSPERFKAAVDVAIKEAGEGADNIVIDLDGLSETGNQDALNQVIALYEEGGGELSTALEDGRDLGEITLRTADVLANPNLSEARAALQPHMRLQGMELTPFQRERAIQALPAEIEKMVQAALGDATLRAENQEAVASVKDELKTRLRGIFPDERQADANAAALAEMITVTAEDLGRDPIEFMNAADGWAQVLQRFGLNDQQSGEVDVEALYDKARSEGRADFRNHEVVFEQEEGGTPRAGRYGFQVGTTRMFLHLSDGVGAMNVSWRTVADGSFSNEARPEELSEAEKDDTVLSIVALLEDKQDIPFTIEAKTPDEVTFWTELFEDAGRDVTIDGTRVTSPARSALPFDARTGERSTAPAYAGTSTERDATGDATADRLFVERLRSVDDFGARRRRGVSASATETARQRDTATFQEKRSALITEAQRLKREIPAEYHPMIERLEERAYDRLLLGDPIDGILLDFGQRVYAVAGEETDGLFQPVGDALNQDGKDSTFEALQPTIERGERKTAKLVQLSADEKASIEKSVNEKKAKNAGVTKEQIETDVRRIKAAHPPSDGWEKLVYTGTKVNDKGKVQHSFQGVPYTFEKGRGDKTLKKGTPAYKNRVDALAAKMTEEVRAVLRRALNEDQNAKGIMAQAGWYKAMRSRLRQEFGALGDLFADLLGATSPNTPVRTNWDFAIEALRMASRGELDDLIFKWESRFNELEAMEKDFAEWFNAQVEAEKDAEGNITRPKRTKAAVKAMPEYKERLEALKEMRKFPDELLPVRSNGAKFGINGRNVARAMVDLWRVVREANTDTDRGGTAPKALNFSGNLIGFKPKATIDVWAARFLQRLSGRRRLPSIVEPSVSGEMLMDGSTTKAFGFGQDVFSAAVAKIRSDPELNTNEILANINDDDLQALVWFIEKEVWTKNNWTNAAGEGGSFELEADLSGTSQQVRVKKLRKIIDSSPPSKLIETAKTDTSEAGAAIEKHAKDHAAEIEELRKLKSGEIEEYSGSAKRIKELEKLTSPPKKHTLLIEKVEGAKKKLEEHEVKQKAARAELASLERPVDRFLGGLSIERSNDIQGEAFVPTDGEMALLSEAIRTAIYEADDGATVLGAKAASTEGRYGDVERALDLEIVAREGYDASNVWAEMLRQARDADQDSTFLSRVLRDGEEYDPLVHRPGVEIYFRDAAGREQLDKMLEKLAEEGVKFLTVAVDGRRRPGAVAGAMPNAVGVRLQYIPELDDPGPRAELAGLDDDALAARIKEKAEELSALAVRVSQEVEGVSFARQFWYETEVAFQHQYSEKIDALTSGIPKRKPAEVSGRGLWAGQSIREGLAGANHPSREDPGLRSDGEVLDGLSEEATGGRERDQQARDGGGRDQSRSLAPLEGAPNVREATGPDPRLVSIAQRYAQKFGIDLKRQAEYTQVDPELAARIARAYEEMEHAPNDPAVREAYADMIRQTRAQFDALVAAGYTFTFFDGATDPYKGNPWNAMRDLRANQTMAVYGTYAGYGTAGITDSDLAGNPMLEPTGLQWPDQNGVMRDVTANDLFRAVHDAFGHGMEGAGFRARGEENAWQAHVRLYTGKAVGAVTTETRGQNSWLNFGPYGESNRNAGVEDTVFAEQKTGLMPEWTWKEGRVADAQAEQPGQTEKTSDQEGVADSSDRLFSKQQNNIRGAFRYRRNVIELFESRNASTLMHEAAHWYLHIAETMQDKSPRLKQQIEAIKKWYGFPEGARIYDENGDVTPEGRELHETFAETFEVYLKEGKAPTAKLREAFRGFKTWLSRLYERIGLPRRANLTPEIREVMDRMLASDAAIESEYQAHTTKAQEMAKEMLDRGILTERQYKNALKRLDAAREEAKERLLARLMQDHKRNLESQYQTERRRVRDEVTRAFDESPVGRAINWLGDGVWWGDRPDLERAGSDEDAFYQEEDGPVFYSVGDALSQEKGNKPFFDPRLSDLENKAVEMARNGFSNEQIAQEVLGEEYFTLGWPVDKIKYILGKARKIGIDVPYGAPSNQLPSVRNQVRKLYGQGLSRAQIAERLGISPETVSWHRKMIRKEDKGIVQPAGKQRQSNRDFRYSTNEDAFYQEEDSEGFYSALERFVRNHKQAKGSAEQWAGILKKAPGIKAEELEWTGVLEWLDGQEGQVTREELDAYLKANGVQIEDVSKTFQTELAPEFQNRMREIEQEVLPKIERRDKLRYEIMGAQGEARAALEAESEQLFREISELQSEARQIEDMRPDPNPPKYESWTLPGGENYTELLLTLPDVETVKRTKMDAINDEIDALLSGRKMHELDGEDKRKMEVLKKRFYDIADMTVEDYRSSHWDEPNVLAHVRFKERTGPNGERVLALEEIQSDWHQAGRVRGYRDAIPPQGWSVQKGETNPYGGQWYEVINDRGEVVGRDLHPTLAMQDAMGRHNRDAVPNAPFKATPAWTSLVLKRMIRYAAENGFDSVAWIPGNIQNGRVVDAADGRSDFYDKIVPNAANKLGKKYGAKITKMSGGATVSYDPRPEGVSDEDWFNMDTTPTNLSVDFWSLPITPELRDVALNEGFPLFSRGKGDPPAWGPVTPPTNLPPMRLDLNELRVTRGNAAVGALPPSIRKRSMEGSSVAGMLEVIRSVRATLKQKGPLDLLDQIVQLGGIPDYGGEVIKALGKKAVKPGLIMGKPGVSREEQDFKAPSKSVDASKLTPDQAVKRAAQTGDRTVILNALIERGYLEEGASEQDLVDLIVDQLQGGTPIYSRSEETVAQLQEIEQAEQWAAWFEENGVDIYAKQADLKKSLKGLVGPADDLVSIEDVADAFGFETGDQLLEAMRVAGSRQAAIQRETDRQMVEEFGDVMKDGTIELEAEKAALGEIHQYARELELEALQNAIGKPAAKKLARDMARKRVEMMSVRELRKYRRFYEQEQRWADAAIKAMKDSDLVQAALHQQRRMIASEMYLQAEKALAEVNKVHKHLRGWQTIASRREKVSPDWLEKIDSVLEGYELRKAEQSASKREEIMRVRDYVNQMLEDGREAEVAPEAMLLADRANEKAFFDLSYDEVLYLRDTIKNMAHVGRLKQTLLNNQDRRAFDTIVNELVETLDAVKSSERFRSATMTTTEEAVNLFRKFDAYLTRLEHQFRTLDGRENGPLWNQLFRPLAGAADVESQMMREAGDKLQALFDKYSLLERQALWTRRVDTPEIVVQGKPLTKMDIIVIALNWGNSGNRQAIMDGYGWDEDAVQSMLERVLDDRDWDFVEGMWDLIGSFRDDAFKLQKDITGSAPEAVEAEPFKLASGREIKGGYYPLKYDGNQPSALSVKQMRLDEKQALQELGTSFTRPMTRKGHLIERVGSGGKPVKLDLQVAVEHVQNVAHDIAYRRAVIDMHRIIRDERFSAAYITAAGRDQYDKLVPWLTQVASNQTGNPGGILTKMMQRLRKNASIVFMGYKTSTALQQLSGAFGAIPIIGTGYSMRGFAKAFAGGPKSFWSAWESVAQKSEYMRSRPQSMDRDMRAVLTDYGPANPLRPVQKYAFFMIGVLDAAVSTSVWIGAYDKAMDGKVDGIQAGSEADAAAFADSVVRRSQSAGLPQDLPEIMRDDELMKHLTMMYSYFSNLYNLTRTDVLGLTRGQISFAGFVGNATVLYAVIPLLAYVMSGRFPPEDEEEIPEALTAEMISNAFGAIPFVRDMANLALRPQFGYQMSPTAGGVERIAQAGLDLADVATGQEDAFEEGVVKSVVFGAGHLFGLPASQMWITGEYLTDLATGEEEVTDPIDMAREGLVSNQRR